jgi:hypothetical protein
LDDVLARRFEEAGGELRVNKRFDGHFDTCGLVRASGRRRSSSRFSAPWFGVKAHFSDVALEADLEIHLVCGGYVGLSRHGSGTVNACGLFRAGPRARRRGEQAVEWLKGPEGSRLRTRMSGARMVAGSSCAVAGLDFAPARAEGSQECRIGDALTMIPPLTGNGMSIALESAAQAARPLAAYARGDLDWRAARLSMARTCDCAFRRRLRWAGLLHAAIFAPYESELMWLAARWPAIALMFYSRTR